MSLQGAKQAELIEGLEKEFVMAARRYNLPLGDFPNAVRMKASLREVTSLPLAVVVYSSLTS